MLCEGSPLLLYKDGPGDKAGDVSQRVPSGSGKRPGKRRAERPGKRRASAGQVPGVAYSSYPRTIRSQRRPGDVPESAI